MKKRTCGKYKNIKNNVKLFFVNMNQASVFINKSKKYYFNQWQNQFVILF